MSSAEVFAENYVEYMKGYFFAAVDGTYHFMLAIDDKFIMMISNVTNNANPANLNLLLKANSYTTDLFNPYLKPGDPQINVTINLKKGYYYFEAVCINYISRGFFKVIVDMPKIHKYTANPAW